MCLKEAMHNLKLSFKEENWGLISQMLPKKCLMAESVLPPSLGNQESLVPVGTAENKN